MINFHPMVKKTGVNTEELGSAVRRRREQQNLSLRDVADQTGVSASTLSRIENGTANRTQTTSRAWRHGWTCRSNA
jgi:ribosome-binding protein aMBF1 (putative translation factor)